MESIYITEAQTTLPDGEIARGPITTTDHETFFFDNTLGTMDLKLEMKKGDIGWYQSGATEVANAEQMIDELGVYIDNHLGNSPIVNKISLE
ncbi:hypothetical protein [Pedobacter hartonius]|uniref:Uncharacterized protein n=1 Tax=Pedobacter hartonius TaxID=425514 RepID=A0A1H4G8V4_9SPHI|nr:hypothetical protein [Pedobacter hartonius]SEB05298.1 hypothetical protein SAMN05443550_10978 [Pedobacter hartonius]